MESIYIDSMGEAASREVTQVAAATSSQDPEIGLAAVAVLRGLVEVLEALQVENARSKGWSWQQVAATSGSPSRPCTTSTPVAGSAFGGHEGGPLERRHPSRLGSIRLRAQHRTGAGRPRVERRALRFAWMTQSTPTFGPVRDRAAVAATLGLTVDLAATAGAAGVVRRPVSARAASRSKAVDRAISDAAAFRRS